ncbi:hypothetical protein M408DRAFT_300300 [Serendipita vermifera MAFF 305830]|uniref:Uncharacterized protein n=1 Tax=Serendipita vermifera MAFF 305830 TaxID=933852 RepID=A0A0C3ARE2_SERVB|nr:hypothetical protein M408DRAFT_300300 [Serendipita vermifera MAFF 305830]
MTRISWPPRRMSMEGVTSSTVSNAEHVSSHRLQLARDPPSLGMAGSSNRQCSQSISIIIIFRDLFTGDILEYQDVRMHPMCHRECSSPSEKAYRLDSCCYKSSPALSSIYVLQEHAQSRRLSCSTAHSLLDPPIIQLRITSSLSQWI